MALTQVSSKGIKDGTILNEDVNASANIAGSKLADNSISLAKLQHGDSNNNGKFLRANNGADPTFESVITDLVNDSSPQLGGNLDVNGKNIAFGDSSDGSSDDVLSFGDSGDLKIWHNGTNTYIRKSTGQLLIGGTGGDLVLEALGDVRTVTWEGENMIYARRNGAVELYHNNVKKLETTSDGIKLASLLDIKPSTYTNIEDNSAYGLNIKHVNEKPISIATGGDYIQLYDLTSSKMYIKCLHDSGVELYQNGGKRLETVAAGVNIVGNLGIGDTSPDYEIDIETASPMIRMEETSSGASKRLDLGVTAAGQPFIAANQSSQSIQIETSGYRRFTFGTSEMYTANNGTDFSWPSNPGHIMYTSGEYRSTSANGTHIRCNRMNGDGHVAQWYRGHTNMVGFISISSGGTSYGSGSSDERTKKNIEDWSESVLNKFKSLTPKLFNFNWEDDTAVKHKGYIAQNEVDKFPEAYPKNNLTDCDDEFYTFTPTDMTVYLMKGLKEAAEKIAALETKVAALEAA